MSFWSVAETDTIPRLLYAPGYIGEISAFTPLLPAAQTFRIPAASTATIASFSAWLYAPPPQELLLTRMLKPCCFKVTSWLKHRIASESLPLPLDDRNLQPRICVRQLIPAIPLPLSA